MRPTTLSTSSSISLLTWQWRRRMNSSWANLRLGIDLWSPTPKLIFDLCRLRKLSPWMKLSLRPLFFCLPVQIFRYFQSHLVLRLFIDLSTGFDTTANALGYTSWMLASHPEVLKRCQEEIDEFCCDEVSKVSFMRIHRQITRTWTKLITSCYHHSFQSISYEDVVNLTYTEAVCKETLRFYPLGAL